MSKSIPLNGKAKLVATCPLPGVRRAVRAGCRAWLALSLIASSPLLAQQAPPATGQGGEASAPSTEALRFDILEFRIDGNRVLSTLAIEQAVYPFLGEGKQIRDAEAARGALEKAYHSAGYLTVAVDIPEQKVEAGVVRLLVVEGHIERLRVSGSRYFSHGFIRARVPSLAPGTVPNFPQAQDELAQVNRTPDRRVTPILRPGRSPGSVEVELKVEDELPLHGNVELTNRRSPNTSELRFGAGLRYDNLWQRDHSVGMQFQTAPQDRDDVMAFSATYLLPLTRGGAQLALYAVDSQSDVAAVGNVNVIGNGTIFGLRLILPLPALAPIFHSLTLGVDHKDFGETVAVLGADDVNTPITYVPLVAAYNLTLSGERRRTQFSAGATIGVRDLLGNRDEDFAAKRFRARSNFLAFKSDLEHERWSASGWGFKGRIDLQLADQPLISNEQFSAGGVESVRGYLENEVQGDDGVRVRAEAHSPLLWTFAEESAQGLAAVGFIEAATLRVQDPLPSQQSSFKLAGVGIGLRLRGARNWSGALDVAWPLRDAPHTSSGSPRLHLRIGYEF